jgi:hypothetical protein
LQNIFVEIIFSSLEISNTGKTSLKWEKNMLKFSEFQAINYAGKIISISALDPKREMFILEN